MIGLICESATDTPFEVLEKDYVRWVSLRVILGEKEYRDVLEISQLEVLKFMETDIPKTSLPNYKDTYDAFEDLIKKGYEEIFAVTISSGISGTYNLFENIALEMRKKYSVKIKIIDSKNISIGAGVIVYRISELIDMGKDFEYIQNEMEKIVGEKTNVFFLVPTLKYLKANGRIGKVSASIGTFLNIKPIISVNKEGMYFDVAKSRGMKRSVEKLLEVFQKWVGNKKINAVGIYKSGNSDQTNEYVQQVIDEINKMNPNKVFVGDISSVALVHTGDGLVGIAAILY
ncbi:MULTISPECIES: DegV family protein [Oceanotoga]|uniref:DegV family protein with EDD domain n=1 Tax=Oceanotoga teriensis TaxID=515440 RepID=A0AA45HI19_9BACT|nr:MULTISPECIES: DegV family protein [Oceanotoga]MDO7976164.1 DegV family protein [Oceanotoga teriensis]PWJ88516.1 DegV family protein with EDD domain [Oceanotoga teriensis]